MCPVCGVYEDQFVAVDIDRAGFISDLNSKIVIIGNSAAGVAAATAIRARNQNCPIEIFSAESEPGYNRPMLTKGLITKIEKLNFYIKPDAWYKDNNITLKLSAKVTEILKDSKEIVLADGEKHSYDKLIIATGARAIDAGIIGQELAGVFSIRDLDDIHEIQKMLGTATNVVVLGSGVLGLEAAWELKKAKKNVTIIDRSGIIMSKQLDEKGSKLCEEALTNSEINIVHNAIVDSIISEDGKKFEGAPAVSYVVLEDGSKLIADMVIVSIGITPNIEIAKNAGIDTGRFIRVNENMGTSIPDIYACGDCAEFNGQSFGIWNQALEMGKVAGANAIGDKVVYKQITPMNSFNGLGTSIFAVGDNGKDKEKKYKSVEFLDDAKNTYEKLYFVNDRLCGAILIGDVKRSVRLSKAYENQESLSKIMGE